MPASAVIEEYHVSMPKSPTTEIIARGLLIQAGHVLLCMNRKHGYTYLPGGHIEFAEPAGEALRREMLEECNEDVRVGPLLLTHEETFKGPKRTHHEINMVFHMELTRAATESPNPINSAEDHIGFVWVDLAELIDIDLRPQSMKAWLMSGGGVDEHAGPILSAFPAELKHEQPAGE
jgi:8-oxo-dGTP diphosphatase